MRVSIALILHLQRFTTIPGRERVHALIRNAYEAVEQNFLSITVRRVNLGIRRINTQRSRPEKARHSKTTLVHILYVITKPL